MTTGYTKTNDVDLEALDAQFDAANACAGANGAGRGVVTRSIVEITTRPVATAAPSQGAVDNRRMSDAIGRATVSPVKPPVLAEENLVAPLDGEASSAPNSSFFVLRRVLRTTAPIVVSDVAALSVSGVLAHLIVSKFFPLAAGTLFSAEPLVLAALLAAYALSALYAEIWVHPVLELRQVAHVNTVVLLAAAVAGIAAPPLPIWCAITWVLSVALVPMLRTIIRHCCVGQSWWGYPTLVIGSGDGATNLARMLLEVPRSGLRPVLVTDPRCGCRSSIMPVMNDPATLESILRTEGIRHAVVCLPDWSHAQLSALVDRYGGLIPHLLVMSDTSTLPSVWGASRNSGGLSGMEVRNALLLATLMVVKRLLDLVLAATTLVIALPLMFALVVIMKLATPGPVFFGHTRVGRHGRHFRAWKFRTMHVNGDEILRQRLETDLNARSEWARDQKLRDDPRVTGVGRFLRKTSLDELPQIWNVLKGDMSLVGPRPIVEGEIVRYGAAFKQYTSVKPGITGLWQVSGRTDINYDDRVQLDLFYIRHWSPWLDVYILAKTVVALISRDGAY